MKCFYSKYFINKNWLIKINFRSTPQTPGIPTTQFLIPGIDSNRQYHKIMST